MFNPEVNPAEVVDGGWEIPLPDERKVVVIRFADSLILEAHRKETEHDADVEEFDGERVYPHGQPVFRKDGSVVHRWRLSNEAARAVSCLIGVALDRKPVVSVSTWEITAGAEPGTVNVLTGEWKDSSGDSV